MSKSIVNQLAHSLGRRDELPNIELAEKLVKAKNTEAIRELAGMVSHSTRALSYDAIKVLYEVGERNPELISAYLPQFLETLHHPDNRMKWGAMIALSVIAKAHPELLAKHMIQVVDAMDAGTVITRDHGIYILASVACLKKYHTDCMELLLEQIEKAPVNQFPMYAEKTAEVISQPYVAKFISILKKRRDVMEVPSKARRMEKLLKLVSSRK